MRKDDFDLEKELAQSKINININDIYNSNKFLKTKEWDYLDDNKIQYLENKVNQIYRELNKQNINNLAKQINNISFESYYNDYKITENKYKISCLSSINFLVEATYYFRDDNKDFKKFDRDELSKYAYKFRNVKGDGDCFYRGLIFSLLENIILTNNIMQMKELLILYYEKINTNNKLVKEKEYLKIINKINISIVSEIMYIIIAQMENDITAAYTSLLKVFLFSKNFDESIIIFTRYLIYEYIFENENKIYSGTYNVEVGCLLPDEFVVDKGNKNEYFFENFFTLQLMNPKTFAEKIIIYVTPFVFNINMNILVYDYGNKEIISNIQEKNFSNEKKNNSQIQINLLFRKSHYDIYYKKNFYEEHQNNLNILINKKENDLPKNNIKSFNENQIKSKDNYQFRSQNNCQFNNKDNSNNNSQYLNLNKFNNNSKPNEKSDNFLNVHENYENYNQKDISICSECYQPRSNNENNFYLCDKCLSNYIMTELLSAYFEFLKSKDNLINSEKKFKNLLIKKKCTINNNDNISIFEAIHNNNLKFKELFLTVRSQLCLYCAKSINDDDEYFIELPCKCRICKQECFIEYLDRISKHIELKENVNPIFYKNLNLLTCFCGFIYNTQYVLEIIKHLEQKGMKEQMKVYQDYINNVWNWKCFQCIKNFKISEKFYKMKFECKNIDKNLLDSTTEFKHLLCDECYQKYGINKTNKIACNICDLEHEIVNINGVNEKNEESSCIIF